MAWLQAEIERHDELYFREAAPEISDPEYDSLKRELKALAEAHPESGVNLNAMRDDRTGRFHSVLHRVRMLGLEKCYNESELRRFVSSVVRVAGTEVVRFIVEPKYDGLAISLVYLHGTLTSAVTRGDGREGEEVLSNLLACSSVPRRLTRTVDGPPWPDLVEIRGEVYMKQEEFERLNRERAAAGEPLHAHPRNLAVGTLKSADAAILAGRHLSFVGYGRGAWEPEDRAPGSQRELLGKLRAWGVPVPPAETVAGFQEVWRAVHAIDVGRSHFPAPLDGAVIKVDDVALRDRLGQKADAPAWAMAYKFEPERVETRLRAIVWQVGRTGVLTPVAEFEPVTLGGTRVSRASLQNRHEIERRDYRIGDLVRVEKAGEVVPQLVGVNLAARPAASVRYLAPEACPACGVRLLVEETALRCPNRACPAQVKRRIEHFVGDSAMDLRGFGPTVVAALVDKLGIGDVHELYRLTPDQWRRAVDGRIKIAERLAAEVDGRRRGELWRLIHGLGLPGVGAANARRLARQCGGLIGFRDATPETLSAAGLSGAAARELAAELRRPEVRALLDGLIAAGVSPER